MLAPFQMSWGIVQRALVVSSPSAFGSVSFLDVSHSNVVSHCFSLLFPNDTKLRIFSCAYILS